MLKVILQCVEYVKVKTIEYKDETFQNNDKYGFIARELQKEFNRIVKANKDKHSDEKFLKINYMILSVVLWGC